MPYIFPTHGQTKIFNGTKYNIESSERNTTDYMAPITHMWDAKGVLPFTQYLIRPLNVSFYNYPNTSAYIVGPHMFT